ncbi:MAG TPA: RNA methyltransferase [Spirochaetia bacterium]|nr:RNA methyltransferase [Spirochaetales bacterium]HRY80542.1 RNA methyltransferase [Spirochaetia bacterium]
MKSPPEFVVVLCRAREPGNVGAACRAMAAMGLGSLVLADCPDHPPEPVKTFALAAYPLFERARRFGTLEDALADCALAAGFTRRTGRLRVREPRDVTEFARDAIRRSGRIALVFGNEADGLSASELALCDLAVRIPTSDVFPSLNLAQAVQIAAWELARARAEGGRVPPSAEVPGDADGPAAGPDGTSDEAPAARAEILDAVEAAAEDLARAGFFKISGRPDFVRVLRSLLARAGASGRELEYLRRILGKAAALSGRRPKP